jgi:hypothetical protein
MTDLTDEGGKTMRETRISLPELALVAGTRAALGAGVALLNADRLSDEQRKAVGWTLVGVGVLSTIPLAMEILGSHRLSDSGDGQQLYPSIGPDLRAMATPR